MNCKQANEISIIQYLRRQGIVPERVNNDVYWYLSPLHKENTASFKVDEIKNVWKDFGTGEGGKLIDFVCKLNYCNISKALEMLNDSFFLSKANNLNSSLACEKKNKNAITINHIQDIQNVALIQYLQERKINTAIAKQYLKEAYYTINDKRYFALAFKNDAGGYELRNKYYKGGSSPKDITTIIINGSTDLNLFEGFSDFLSYLIHNNIEKPTQSTIILNSLIFIDKVKTLAQGYKTVNCYFDNDTAGSTALNNFTSANSNIIDKSTLYRDYKDFNDFLINK